MITLNRPYSIPNHKVDYTADVLYDRSITWLYSSREGLNLIYGNLYKERGSLKVAVSPLTCFEALYPIINNGHTIHFVDINEKTLNMNEDLLTTNIDIDVVQLIYLGGNPMDIAKVLAWANANKVIIVEDCAQALGSTYQGLPVGSLGDYAVYSSVKNLYAISGGFMLAKHKIAINNASKIHPLIYTYKHIKHWLETKTNAHEYNLWNIVYKQLLQYSGRNAKSSTIFHTLKPSQVKQNKILLNLSEQIQNDRMKNVNKILSMIDTDKYFIQQELDGAISCRNRVLLLSKNRLAKDIINELRMRGIAANNLTQSYINAYQESVSTDSELSKFYTSKLEVYERVLPRLLAIPSSPALTLKEIEYIVNQVNQLG